MYPDHRSAVDVPIGVFHDPGAARPYLLQTEISGRQITKYSKHNTPEHVDDAETWQVRADGRTWITSPHTRPGWRTLWGLDKTALCLGTIDDGEYLTSPHLGILVRWAMLYPARAIVTLKENP